MKLCDIVHTYTARGGGVRTYVDAKRAWLRAATDVKHVLIIPAARDQVSHDGRMAIHEIGAPEVPGYRSYRIMLRSRRIMEILRVERPHLIELANAHILPGPAFRYRDRCPSAVVGFYHADYPNAYVGSHVARIAGAVAGRKARELASAHVRAIHSRCDRTITSSPALASMLRRIGISSVSLMPLGVDGEVFHPRRRDPAFRATLGASEQSTVLVYAGRFDGEKQVDLLVRAYRRMLPSVDVHLLMIGDGPARPTLVGAAAELPHLHIFPYEADKERLARMLASADIYVTAGPHETFGLSVLEAQACGLPVVGVRAGALVERVDSATGFLGAPGCAEDLARNVLRMTRDQRIVMGREARRRVETEHSWEGTFARLLNIYESTIRLRWQGVCVNVSGAAVRPSKAAGASRPARRILQEVRAGFAGIARRGGRPLALSLVRASSALPPRSAILDAIRGTTDPVHHGR